MSERLQLSHNWITQMSYNSVQTTVINDRMVAAPYVRILDTLAYYHGNTVIGLTLSILMSNAN